MQFYITAAFDYEVVLLKIITQLENNKIAIAIAVVARI
jgi:hypothetical protein